MWLRGEADQIAADRLARLRLGDESPGPADVVRGVSELLALAGVPLVLCFDQIDALFGAGPTALKVLTDRLIGWLGTVPNVVIILGCLDHVWQEASQTTSKALTDRLQDHRVAGAEPDEAAELVVRRMRAWEEFEPGGPDGWPFDLDAVRRLVGKVPMSPRGFLQECSRAFDEWRAAGRKGLVQLGGGQPPVTTEPELFVQEWTKQLAATRVTLKPAVDYQDTELWSAVSGAVEVARLGGHLPAGVRFDKVTPQALAKSPADPRPSAELHLVAGSQRASVVVAVSKKDGGPAFAGWVTALEGAVGGQVAGAVVVWPKSKLAVGKTTAGYKKYEARVAAGTVRPFPLDDNVDTHAQLECLRRLVDKALAGDLMLGDKPVTPVRCRELAAETKVLANLKLFGFLFENWPAVEAARASVKASPEDGSPVPACPSAGPSPVPANGPSPRPDRAPVTTPVAGPPRTPVPPPAAPESNWADQMLTTVVEKLRERGQSVRPVGTESGPTFVRLKLELKGDADFGKVKRQVDNLRIQLGLDAKPLIASQAGHISVDVQRPDRQTVPLTPLLATRPPALVGKPAFPAGVDVAGRPHWVDLSDPATCHLLVAGASGSGKSEFLKAMLAGLAAGLGPDAVQFVLIDPKQVTFRFAGDSPYLNQPIVYDGAEAVPVVERCYQEMQRRYGVLRAAGKEHVGQLVGAAAVPRWVVVVDEFADLMAERQSKKELEVLLKRLGGMARAAGIHLVLGTQRPEASVVTPILRSNLIGRVALGVATERESRLVIDAPDAAYLLLRGDLLVRQGGGLVRLQSPFVPRAELENLLRVH